MAEGFLDRWSQRKQAQRAGKVLAEPPATPAPAVGAQEAQERGQPEVTQPLAAVAAPAQAQPAAPAPAAPPPPSLEDVGRLTPQSDFAPFVARDVAPEVRNAAMKKLFADPHYNVMDRLDTYIDDYSKPDPLPESMLRQMASAKFLKLFDDEDEDKDKSDATTRALRDDANTPTGESVAQSVQPPPDDAHRLTDNPPQALGTDHDHTDLRLQQDHAAGPQEPGRGTQ